MKRNSKPLKKKLGKAVLAGALGLSLLSPTVRNAITYPVRKINATVQAKKAKKIAFKKKIAEKKALLLARLKKSGNMELLENYLMAKEMIYEIDGGDMWLNHSERKKYHEKAMEELLGKRTIDEAIAFLKNPDYGKKNN